MPGQILSLRNKFIWPLYSAKRTPEYLLNDLPWHRYPNTLSGGTAEKEGYSFLEGMGLQNASFHVVGSDSPLWIRRNPLSV